MSFWLICLPRADMEHCIEIGTIGLGRAQTINKVRSGDKIVCIVTKEKPWRIIAVGNTTSDYYADDKPIFRKAGTYIDRFDFRAHKLNPEPSFTDAIEGLSFITKKESWPAYFKSGIVRLPEADWHVLNELTKVGV